MTTALGLPNAAVNALGAKTGDDARPALRLAAAIKFYALGRLTGGVLPASAGNGRVEFLSRLTKFGSRFGKSSEHLAWAVRRPMFA
jgi:hypothetical protein